MLDIIQWFALILAAAALIKIIVILIKPISWIKVVDTVYAIPMLTAFISLVLSAVVLFYLIEAGFGIVDIFAVMLFLGLLAAVGVSVYAKEFLPLARKMLKDRTFVKKSWLYIIIWIVLIIWVF